MVSRRKFLIGSALASSAALLGFKARPDKSAPLSLPQPEGPVVISTWQHGLAANDAAWKILASKGTALDAVEQGVRVPEGDPKVRSVGYGGLPDREGNVTLDACIMDEKGRCGGVAFLKGIKHPISVARLIMEKTPHVLLAGEGALQFALDNNFKQENLLTEEARQQWEKWKTENPGDAMFIDQHNHDTIGMLALDVHGNLSGACTTSGLAWKYHGRVGDSPIIGAGLFVDNEIGAATATGKGEEVIKIAGSFLIVELMRNGRAPQEACEEAIHRITSKSGDSSNFQVGFLAIDKAGTHGAYGIRKGFQYALCKKGENKLTDAATAYNF